MKLEAQTRLLAASEGNKLAADILKKFKAQKLEVKLNYVDDDPEGDDQMEFTIITPGKKTCVFSIGPCSKLKPTWLEFDEDDYRACFDPLATIRHAATGAPLPAAWVSLPKNLSKWGKVLSKRADLCAKATTEYSTFLQRFQTAVASIL